ncbi:MAG: tail fiber domain-containing protein [Aureispira sp.]
MKHFFTGLLVTLAVPFVQAQNVGIGLSNPNPSAKLEISATNQGVLLPRVALTSTTDATTIANGNVPSLLVYNTATISDVSPGFYYWTGAIWQRMAVQQDADWYSETTALPPTSINENVYTMGSVGIENSAPITKLHIGTTGGGTYRSWMNFGTFYGTDSDGMYVGLKNEGADREDAIIAWGDNTSDHLRFLFNLSGSTGSAEYMRITGTGNVGIGTTTPTYRLEVDGGFQLSNSLGSRIWSERFDSEFDIVQENTSTKRAFSIHPGAAGADPLAVYWHDGTQHQPSLHVLNTNGNVGIKTQTPTNALTVNGVAEIRKVGTRSSIYFTNLTTDAGYIRHIVNNNAAEMRFVVSDDVDANSSIDYFSFGGETGSVFTEIMRINGARNVGIGTTAPAQRLHVVGNILASGTITSSDRRYKRNSQALVNSTALLQQLNPVQYYFKEGFAEGQFDDRLHFGLLAQEVEAKLPHLVHEDQEGYKGINYTELIPVLIKSNQEQQVLIEQQNRILEQQQAQIEALQKNMEALNGSK